MLVRPDDPPGTKTGQASGRKWWVQPYITAGVYYMRKLVLANGTELELQEDDTWTSDVPDIAEAANRVTRIDRSNYSSALGCPSAFIFNRMIETVHPTLIINDTA